MRPCADVGYAEILQTDRALKNLHYGLVEATEIADERWFLLLPCPLGLFHGHGGAALGLLEIIIGLSSKRPNRESTDTKAQTVVERKPQVRADTREGSPTH